MQALSDWGGLPLFLGVHPCLTPDDLPLLDKKRYRIMYSTMKEVDTHGQWMMKATSGVQVSLDFVCGFGFRFCFSSCFGFFLLFCFPATFSWGA